MSLFDVRQTRGISCVLQRVRMAARTTISTLNAVLVLPVSSRLSHNLIGLYAIQEETFAQTQDWETAIN